MVHGAALIVGIGGTMIVLAAALVDVMAMGVLPDASASIIYSVLLGGGDMLEMNDD